MFDAVSLWGHAAAATLFGVLCIWAIRRFSVDRQAGPMMLAFLLMAFWGLVCAIKGPYGVEAHIAGGLRNLGWLGLMYAWFKEGSGDNRALAPTMLYVVVAAIGLGQLVVAFLPAAFSGSPRLLNAIFFSTMLLQMVFAVAGLVLAHNLYTAATPEARHYVRLPLIALAILGLYDLNLFTISYLSRGWSTELLALRGVAATLVAPLFGIAMQQGFRARIRMSRTATFQSLSLVAIGGYLMMMVLATSAIEFVAGEHARATQIIFVFGSSVVALALLPSKTFRAWARVKLAKHLFQHRYDYRAEWVRFADTISKSASDAGLDSRAVQAIGDITESEGGILLVPDSQGVLILQARWNSQTIEVPSMAGTAELVAHLASTGRIVELDRLREEGDDETPEAKLVPEWLVAETRAWALVPLLHFGRLIGVAVLERPKVYRALDWEDFDLLKVVGRQVASYLAEARGQEALSDVRQFDEFNRRFAFIMHDVKNLVSQLTLLTRNAEKHADNPEFRADMIATLKNSAGRMNDLLARLSQHNKARADEPRALELGALIEAVAQPKRMAHPIVTGGDMKLHAIADAARLEQALSHIVQNAIDASPATEPVSVTVRRVGQEVLIETLDHGSGMSRHFVQHELFKAFASTKDAGFGIGAFEARALVTAMGGRVEVLSREGEGTRFNIYLPLATEAALDVVRVQKAMVA